MHVIDVENISKKYIIDHKNAKGKDTFRELLMKKINPFSSKEEEDVHEEFWALKNLSFGIEEGDRVGIVGSNGAGKSTLLKVLSRITDPTSGKISIKGRVASLLEVGTGFHPELTGRENIFLNGAILGMKRDEIKAQFDAIVDFGGIEKFLDTPVKRYSSGMYVRLGFAIAAHLNPEILIIDEVLAVGDADFQMKCLGKMKDISATGRTILFVSHNMIAVQGLCNKAVFLQKGQLIEMGETNKVLNHYISKVKKTEHHREWATPQEAPGNDLVRFKSVKLVHDNQAEGKHLDVKTPFKFQIECWNMVEGLELNLSLHLNSLTGETIFNVGTQSQPFQKGVFAAELLIPANFMNDGTYSMSCMIVQNTVKILYNLHDALIFDIEDHRGDDVIWYDKWAGAIRPTFLPFPVVQKEIF